MLPLPTLALLALALALAGCGGGGGTGGSTYTASDDAALAAGAIDLRLVPPSVDTAVPVTPPPSVAVGAAAVINAPAEVFSSTTGAAWWSASATVAPGGWWGISIPRSYLPAGYAALAIVTPVTGNPDVYAYAWDRATATYRFLRGSAWNAGRADETHVFASDLASDQQLAVVWVQLASRATSAASFVFEVRLRRNIPLALPTQLPGEIDYYTPTTVPVIGVMDHSRSDAGLITAYNGTVASAVYGCKRCVVDAAGRGTWIDCPPGEIGDPAAMLGYRMSSGTPRAALGLNYVDNVDNTYLFYDGHTGYDFVPTADPLGVAVYAALGGRIHFAHDRNNTVYIDHGGGWRTYYLHMLDDAAHTYYKEGDYVGTGYRIGHIGGTGGYGPHLHFEVRSAAVVDGYVDPYASRLWRQVY